MQESFIKSIIEGKPNEEAHRLLLRFGMGTFDREKIALRKSKMIDASAGYDYLGLFQDIFLSYYNDKDIEYSGVVIGQDAKKTAKMLEENNVKIVKSTGKKHTVKGVMKGSRLKEIKDELFNQRAGFLVSLSYDKNTLKTKTSYPKPGKTVEGFVKMKIDVNADSLITEGLCIDIYNKKAVILTQYEVHNVLYDEKLLSKDPVIARLESKRDVTITRNISLDKEEKKEVVRAKV
ncbi:MAG: hypothetical protein ACMXYL_05240 [Candidatus Woesearchaeota archaeon]